MMGCEEHARASEMSERVQTDDEISISFAPRVNRPHYSNKRDHTPLGTSARSYMSRVSVSEVSNQTKRGEFGELPLPIIGMAETAELS